MSSTPTGINTLKEAFRNDDNGIVRARHKQYNSLAILSSTRALHRLARYR